MKVISFFTTNTPYEQEAANLRKSLETYQIPYRIYEVESRGSWQLNCLLKPKIIRQALRDFRGDVLFVDADATFHGTLELLAEQVKGYDWAAYVMDKAKWNQSVNRRTHSLMSGTIWFNNSVGARNVLFVWENLIANEPKEWDQRTLEKCFHLKIGRFCLLTEKYCCIDKTHWGVENPVIRHHQASRRLRRLIR